MHIFYVHFILHRIWQALTFLEGGDTHRGYHHTLPSEGALFFEVALGGWCDERWWGMMQTHSRWIPFLPFSQNLGHFPRGDCVLVAWKGWGSSPRAWQRGRLWTHAVLACAGGRGHRGQPDNSPRGQPGPCRAQNFSSNLLPRPWRWGQGWSQASVFEHGCWVGSVGPPRGQNTSGCWRRLQRPVRAYRVWDGDSETWQEGVAGVAAAEDYGDGEKGIRTEPGAGKWDGVNFPGLAGFLRSPQSHYGCLGYSRGGGVVCSDIGSCCWRWTFWDFRTKGMQWEPLPHWGYLQISTDLAWEKRTGLVLNTWRHIQVWGNVSQALKYT